MLVLSRKRGQKILLPDLGVTFTILEVRGDRVRVGISAPSGMMVHREEIWQRIQPISGEGVIGETRRGMSSL